MEIKTCEEYVLNELDKCKKSYDKLMDDYNDECHLCDAVNDKNKTLNTRIEVLTDEVNFLKSLFTKTENGDIRGKSFYSFETDNEDMNTLIDYLSIDDEEMNKQYE